MDLGSYIINLELRLSTLNQKLIFWDKMFSVLKKIHLHKLVTHHIKNLIEKRDKCFTELRDVMREKYPEKFIRSVSND